MRLELGTFPVEEVRFGSATRWDDGLLEVNRAELEELIRSDSRITSVSVELACPGESTRITHVRDVIDPIRRRKMSDRQQIRWTRWIIVGIGAFLIAWGIWYELPDSVWGYMAITGTVYLSGAGVAIIGGMYWRGASSAGAMAALLGGLVAVVGLFIKPIHEHVLPELSKEVLAGALGVGNYVFCALLFIVFSLSFPDRNRSDSAGTDALAEQ